MGSFIEMSPVEQATKIATEFDQGCSTTELKKCYQEFKRLLVLGLKEDGHDMPCIPSYGISFLLHITQFLIVQ